MNLYTRIKAVLLGRGFSPPLRSAQFFGNAAANIRLEGIGVLALSAAEMLQTDEIAVSAKAGEVK
jgi:hypothetical protein